MYSNSSESNVTSCLAHVTTLSAKSVDHEERAHYLLLYDFSAV